MKQTHPYVALAGCKTVDEFYKKFPNEEQFFQKYPEAREQIPQGHMANGGQYFPQNFEALELIPSGHMQTGGFIMPGLNPVDMPTMYTEHMAAGGYAPRPDYHFDGTQMVKTKGTGTYNSATGNYFKYGGGSRYSQYGGKPDFDEDVDEMKKGGIHIKPENKGKFTATKARTGKTTEELTHSSDPVTRKRAVFAQNAKSWSHKKEFGGLIQDNDYPDYDDAPIELAYGGNPFTAFRQFMQMGGKQDTDLTTDPVTGQPLQPTQAPAFNPAATGVVPQAPLPPGVQDNPAWRVGMTDDQAQTSIGPDRNNSLAAPASSPQHRGPNPYGQTFGNLLGAGLMTASYFEDKRNQRNSQDFNRQLGMSSSMPKASTPGGYGDYTQQGKFRPTQGTPSQSAGMSYMENGGIQYQKGGTYEIDEQEANRLTRLGYKLEKA